jgi:cytoskeletal protein CcmA (bactofilin family)
MWRKSSEVKPTEAASNTPASALTRPEEAPQATSQSSAPPPAGSARQQVSTTSVVTREAPSATAPGATPTHGAPSKGVSATALRPVPEPVDSGGASTISSGLKIKGEITGTSDLTIDGETHGKVRLVNGRVTVGASGRVHADIEAREIVVNGEVQGNLKASESVRLGPSGSLEGSVLTRRIGIDDGARLRGNVEMIRAGETPESAKDEPAKSTQAVRAASASAHED